MARRQTVNFLQIESGLERAIELCAKERDAPYSVRYRPRLREIREHLDDMTARTDHTYLEWRSAMRTRLRNSKSLFERFNQIREELGEYGIAAEPGGRIGYWEADEIVDAARTLAAQLDDIDAEDVPEAPDWHGEIVDLVEAVEAAERNEERSLQDYRRIAPRRRQAIYRAMQAVDEFDAVRSDYRR